MSFLFVTSIITYAQYKPLKRINLSDVYISQSGINKSYNIDCTKDIYSSFFYLNSHRLSHHKGIKDPDLGYDSWTIDLNLDTNKAIALNLYANMQEAFDSFYNGITKLKLCVGETLYEIDTWYYSEASSTHRTLMMDITKPITKHISISGLQGIYVDNIEIIAFSDIEQELWRRAAKDVYENRKDL